MERWSEVSWSTAFLKLYPIISFFKLLWIVGRLPSSVVLDDDETRGDDVEAHAPPSTHSRGYQLLSTDTVSIASTLKLLHGHLMFIYSYYSLAPWQIHR